MSALQRESLLQSRRRDYEFIVSLLSIEDSPSADTGRSLAIKLVDCKYRGVIEKCTPRGQIFFGCDPQFLNALLMKLQVRFRD